MNLKSSFNQLESLLTKVGGSLQCVVLLLLRVYWGWQFFETGRGKLMNLDRTAGYFASLDIPLPKLNALCAGTTECVGGLLLLVGLGTRVVSVPLLGVLAVAYLTAESEALHAIFSDPDKFTAATPFLFLLAVVIVFAFGPGRLSLDAWLKRPGAAK
ncbi:MAG: DoxX family protein [Opitutales bacterium]